MGGTREAILRRIGRALGDGVVPALERLSVRDVGSLVLHLLGRQAQGATPQRLLAASAPAFSASAVDLRHALAVATAAFEVAPAFTPVDLPPVAPLGLVHALTALHPDNVLAASRSAEVVADPAPFLALECARRRTRPLKLAAWQQVIRMHPAPPPGLFPHFRLFALATAARRGPDVIAEALREHLAVYLDLFRLLRTRGFAFGEIAVTVTDTRIVTERLSDAGVDLEQVRKEVRTGHVATRYPLAPPRRAPDPDFFAPLAAAYPEANFAYDLERIEGLGYYPTLCVRIAVRDATGLALAVVDGGVVDWTARLLSDGREVFVATGIGVDMMVHRFRSA